MNSKSQVLDLEYDTLNRLVQSRLDGAVTSYSYDNAGNRLVKKTPEKTTLYLRHGQIAVAMDIELPEDASSEKGRVNRYVLSGDLLAGRITRVTAADGVESVEKSYYHLDHLNSTKAVTDDDGVLEVLYEYRAFGEQLKRLDSAGSETDDSAKYSYGGKELDAGSDLYYFNARYYDATIGRFINVDPIQDGSNWYVYVRNNPLGFVDPTGLETMIMSKAIGPFVHLFIAQKDEETGEVSTLSLNPKNGPLAGLLTFFAVRGREIKVEPEITPNVDAELEAAKLLFNGEELPEGMQIETIPSLPEGMSQAEFDELVRDIGLSYPLDDRQYDVEGPNSNTFVDDVIEDAGSSMPSIEGAKAQKWEEE